MASPRVRASLTLAAALAAALAACAEKPAPAPSPAEASGPGPVRLDVRVEFKPPSVPGNPSRLRVCAALYDARDTPVAVEGDFSAKAPDVLDGGIHAYPPMYGPFSVAGFEAPLGICPAGAEVWPEAHARLAGQTRTVTVTFKPAAGGSLSGVADISF